MKKTIPFILLYLLFSCNGNFGVSDYSGPTKNIVEAKKSKLLINIYKPSKYKVIINSVEYQIVEAWTSNRFKTNNSTELNMSVYDFLIIIRNCKTNEIGLSNKTTPEYSKFIKYYCKDCTSYGSIQNDKLCMQFNLKKTPIAPDVIKVGFISKNKEVIISFYKFNDKLF